MQLAWAFARAKVAHAEVVKMAADHNDFMSERAAARKHADDVLRIHRFFLSASDHGDRRIRTTEVEAHGLAGLDLVRDFAQFHERMLGVAARDELLGRAGRHHEHGHIGHGGATAGGKAVDTRIIRARRVHHDDRRRIALGNRRDFSLEPSAARPTFAARPPAGTLLIHRLEAQNHRDLAFERVAFAKAGEAFGSVLDAVADEGDNAIAAAARAE